MSISQIGIYGGVGRLSQNKGITSWWLSGGISAANCVAAYQPKGAASYAASKTNLANPGTYDAADGTAYPTWDATNGWKFAAANSQYLKTGLNTALGMSWIIKFSNGGSGTMAVFGGIRAVAPYDGIGFQNSVNNQHQYINGQLSPISPSETNGVFCSTPTNGYKNGNSEVTITNSGNPNVEIYIGGLHISNIVIQYFSGYVQAFSIYNTAITSTQVTALTTAMNAL